MTAWVEDHWGEELDTVTLQGSTAAFVVGAKSLAGLSNNGLPKNIDLGGQLLQTTANQSNLTPTISPEQFGLTTYFRPYSVSYQEMKNILTAMRTNGARFDTNGLGLVTARYFVRLSFDLGVFDGYLESFDVTEDAASPFRFTYTITFKSEKTVLSYLG